MQIDDKDDAWKKIDASQPESFDDGDNKMDLLSELQSIAGKT